MKRSLLNLVILVIVMIVFGCQEVTTSNEDTLNNCESSFDNAMSIGQLHNHLLAEINNQKSVTLNFDNDGYLNYNTFADFLCECEAALVNLGYDSTITSAVIDGLIEYYSKSSFTKLINGELKIDLKSNDLLQCMIEDWKQSPCYDPDVFSKLEPIIEMYFAGEDPLMVEQAVDNLNANLHLYSEEEQIKLLNFIDTYEASGIYWAEYGVSDSIRVSATVMDAFGGAVGAIFGGAVGTLITPGAGTYVGGIAGGSAGGAAVSELHAKFEQWCAEQEEE